MLQMPRIAYTRSSAPHVAISCPTPPGSEGSKGKRALSGAWGVFTYRPEPEAPAGQAPPQLAFA